MMSSANKGTTFTWMKVIYFSYLLVLDRAFCVEQKWQEYHSCLVPDCGGKGFSFSQCTMMFAVGFLHITSIVLRQFYFLTIFWEFFVMNECWIVKLFFNVCIFWDDHIVLFYLYDESSLYFGYKSYLVMMHNPFDVLLNLV